MTIDGAPFPAWPRFEADEREAALRVLASGRVNYWTGEEGRAFERELALLTGRRHGVALANGSVALELALRVQGIGPGDEVVVTPRSFVASASCVVLAGATPVFADIDRDTQAISAATVEAVLSPRTRAVIPVHLAGRPCDILGLQDLCRRRGLLLIEDCAQAHGATVDGRPVGGFGDIAAFSFCQDKIITTGGEGGMVVMDDDDLFERAWSLKDHGKSREAVFVRAHPPGFRWLHEGFGTNWRMTELPRWLARRRRSAAMLDERLGGLDALRTTPPRTASATPTTSTTASCGRSGCARAGTATASCAR
jgi:dTDP-4-amino-4,6-dideoxygalactose transaminase